jgi:SAM-dependent methyltransferase
MNPPRHYCPEVFAPDSLEHAKNIIIPGGGSDPAFRWHAETEETVAKILRLFAEAGKPLTERSILIDYGCGIGRVAKELIERTGCTVLGADISPGMLELAFRYVNSRNFVICPAVTLPLLRDKGFRADGAIACWTYQHCVSPSHDIALTASLLSEGGLLFVVNEDRQCIPVSAAQEGWADWTDNGEDVLSILRKNFVELADSPFPAELAGRLPASHFVKLFGKRQD